MSQFRGFRGFSEANTYIFWNVDDYPIPNGLDTLSMKEIMEAQLEVMDFCGPVSIQAYASKNTFSDDELLRKFSEAGIKTSILREGGSKYSGIYSMLIDMYLCALRNPPPSNLFVLSKNMDDSSVLLHFRALDHREYGVRLSDAEPYWLPRNVNLAAQFLANLFHDETLLPNNNKRKAELPADSHLPQSQGRPKYDVL
ncbi:PREDICTED: uncharacterized protein LOC104731328 [Camelina sativa]|uniref:Uncharacterized protein LOC104731328 n=1 Tax=Camelina sativa TaxID=90675 RepID=A0ABM1QS51_CAMSA|nr:PREDICTED: uncharacterized protein LOC104731328 [Camelina sativa]